MLAFDEAGHILLIRHSYGSGAWMPPGGGVKRSEDPVLAAIRELAEETGLRLVEARMVTQVVEHLHGARNHVHIVAGRADAEPQADRREVLEARFHDPDALPDFMPDFIRDGLPDWIDLSRVSLST